MHLADERLWPMHGLRLLSPTDAHSVIAAMTRAQVDALIAHHKACHARRGPALGQTG